MSSQSQPCGDAKSAPTEAEISAAVVAFLDRAQMRDLQRDAGHGYRSTRDVANAVGLDKATCRATLEQLSASRLIRREQCSNALHWRSIKPLPWEAGGELAIQHAREAALWAGELTLVVQACSTERGRTRSWDVKAYPLGLRERAEAHVLRENHASQSQRETDVHDGRHLSDGYVSPPRYRLVSLVQEGRSLAGTTERQPEPRADQSPSPKVTGDAS